MAEIRELLQGQGFEAGFHLSPFVLKGITSSQSQDPLSIGQQQPGRQIYQPGSEGIGPFGPAMLIQNKTLKPEHNVVCQDRGLKQCMIGPELMNQHGAESHLILAGADEVLSHGSFVIETLQLKGRPRQVGDPKAVFINRFRKEQTFCLDPLQASDTNKTERMFVSIDRGAKLCGPDALLTARLPPGLLCEEFLPAPGLDFDDVAAALSHQLPDKISAEKGRIGPDHNTPDTLGQHGQTFFQEFAASVGAESIAGPKPGIKAFSGLGDESKDGIEHLFMGVFGIMPESHAFLMTVGAFGGGIQVHVDPGVPFLGPYLRRIRLWASESSTQREKVNLSKTRMMVESTGKRSQP